MQNNPYSTPQVHAANATDLVAVNKVLRNTYMLLGMTILFSAVVAGGAIAMNAPHMNFILMLVLFYGLLFAIHKTQNSPIALLLTFVFTGVLGYSMGTVFNMVLSLPGGASVITTALGGTAVTFFALSAYAITTKKDFSFLSGFMVVGFVVLLVGMIANIFLQMPLISLAMSAGFILFSSAAILYQTGEIVNGGERNYILATITLYVSIYNILMSLIHLLLAFGGDD
jgi:modulator of FtsH protease